MTELSRDELKEHTLFLYGLQSGTRKNNNERLNTASSFQCNVLIKTLHCIANGRIPLKKPQFERLKRSRKISIMNEVKSKENVEKKNVAFSCCSSVAVVQQI